MSSDAKHGSRKSAGILTITLVLGAIVSVVFVHGAPPSPDAFDKDAFRSRKKWYVTFVLSLHGIGDVKKVDGKDYIKTKWNIRREVSGTFEFDVMRTGFNSRPRASVPVSR